MRLPSTFERVEALVRNPAVYAFAREMPVPDGTAGGRPLHYPRYMWVVFDALLSIDGSGRRVEAELADPYTWNRLRQLVVECFPDDRDMWLPKAPIRRHHYLYGRTRYLTDQATLDHLRRIHAEYAARQAREIGLLDPDGPGSWTHPHLSRTLYADGKVVTPLFRAQPGDKLVNKRTGEIRYPRAEADAHLHIEGTGEAAWGCKFVIVATRDTTRGSRIILDTAYVPTAGGEAATATDMFTRLSPHTPGAQAVVYDTALRGVHHQHLLRDLGLLPVNRVTAAAGSRKRGGKRKEKTTYVETKTTADGKQTLKLFAQGGQIGYVELNEVGETVFEPLERIRTHRTRSKAGRYRWYNDYRLPGHLGGGAITVRLHGTDDDTQRKFNRTENVRAIPPGDPDFERLYRRRNDAESINRHLDDTLWLRRAHTIGQRRQSLNMLTYALCNNGLTVQRHRQRTSVAA